MKATNESKRRERITSRGGCVGLCLALALPVVGGCTSGSGEPLEPLPNSGGRVVEGDYPEGTTGTALGSLIENFAFEGYVNARDGLGEQYRSQITLGDFYNPTGDGTYGPDAIRPEGTLKPKALMINVSAVWCGPCKEEAQTTLPKHYKELGPEGMELLMVLADSEAVGSPAGFSHLDNWCTAFDVFYPAAIDPKYQLGGSFDQSQFPANFIVDTRDMTIRDVVSGIPSQGFFDKISELLANEG